jgi:hypothetical protein
MKKWINVRKEDSFVKAVRVSPDKRLQVKLAGFKGFYSYSIVMPGTWANHIAEADHPGHAFTEMKNAAQDVRKYC